jgi:hypothetical protein
MSTTIDSLQIEIQSNSNNAASSIDELAKALKKLNKNGDVSTAVTNLNELRKSLHAFVNMPSSASKIESLANSLKSLKKVGSIDLGKSIGGVKTAMESLKSIDVDGVAPQIERIGEALAPLNSVKGSGFNAMMNGFKKMNEVVNSMDSETIDRFVEKIKELDEKLGPVSQRLVAIGNAFKGINNKALTASGGMSVFGGQVNTTTLNLQSLISVAQNVRAALQPIINLLKYTIGEAIEWDGIEYQFGNSFGEDADKYHDKIVEITDALKINKQTFMENSAMATSMLKGFGVDSADAREMGVGYTELAYDIWAAFNNVYKSFDGADGAMAAVRSAIAGEVEPIRRAGFTIVDSQLAITAANHDLEYSSQKATEAQKSYLRYLTLVDQAHAKGIVGTYASEMDKAEGMVRTFTQQLKSLAQTFGSLFLPVLVKVMPWLQAFVDLLGDAVMAVANFFGVDIQKVDFSDNNSGLNGLSNSADSATESIGGTSKALKELKNATLGIDELNVISPPNAGGGGGGGSPDLGPGYEGLDIKSLWDKSIYDQVQIEVDAIKEKLKEALSGITAVVSGFALAIGTILVVSGANIPVGLGLMAIGAVGLVATIAENWSGMSDELAKTLTEVTSILGGFLLAIGAVLAFSGVKVGLGVALMAAGAVSLATAATINWKFLEGDLENAISIMTGIVAGGLLALGALFAFTGVDVKLGIALMAAGAVGLAAAVGLNWNSLSEPMKKAIGTLEAIVGGGLLAFGALLALTGVNVPIGLAMITAGVVSLVSAVALNWNSLNGKVKNTLATIGTIVGGALLGIGAILALTGVATGVGIAMIAAGAVSIIAAAPVNWNGLVSKIKNVVKEIGFAVGASLLALGAVLAFTGVSLPIGIAMMAAGAVSMISAAALNWNSMSDQLKKTLTKVLAVVGTASLALGVILCLSGVGLPLGIALIAAWAASTVTAVALNWKVFENIGSNCVDGMIKGFSDLGTKIKKKFNEAVQKVKDFLGIKSPSKLFGEIGAFCQQGLINAFGVSAIKDRLSTMWSNAKTWWNKNVKLSIPSLSFKVTYTEVTGWKKAIVSALGLQGWPKLSFAANGGIFDTGSLVWAGEAGPEIVANAGGGKTGVMNVQQMSEAVYEGVYSAVVAAMRSSGGNGNGAQSVNVYLDGKQITATVEKRQAERGATLMTGGVAYGY